MTMDLFDIATRRLEQDQSKIRVKLRSQGAVVSEQAKKGAEFRKKQQEKLRQERYQNQRQQEHVRQYFTSCERGIGVRSLGEGGLKLHATSIHGDGDKIALPPSVLQRLTSEDDFADKSSPWTFRVGILNPKYVFPSSSKLSQLPVTDGHDDTMDDSDHDNDDFSHFAPYLEELAHKYLSYSHGTVIEFTQEEGYIGLPISIASALLNIGSDAIMPVTRSKDPSSIHEDSTLNTSAEHTPGHFFWNGFDLPELPLEVSLVKLPKGQGCTLVPTRDAILNGFYDLKNVKMVLEQSLIRTRATLSLRDTVHTWYRGVKYDLVVTKVTPGHYGAVNCINTDIEVDLGTNEEVEREVQANALTTGQTSYKREEKESMPKAGYKLSDMISSEPLLKTQAESTQSVVMPEPPMDQTEDVCTVQISADGKAGRRRLDVKVASLADLFAFAASVIQREPNSFRLVTRFPRRVLTLSSQILEDAGINAGQELFMVENI